MSTESGSLFQFEIVITLVLVLLVYLFASVAWNGGQYLWQIQDRINRLALERQYAPTQIVEGHRPAQPRSDDDDSDLCKFRSERNRYKSKFFNAKCELKEESAQCKRFESKYDQALTYMGESAQTLSKSLQDVGSLGAEPGDEQANARARELYQKLQKLKQEVGKEASKLESRACKFWMQGKVWQVAKQGTLLL